MLKIGILGHNTGAFIGIGNQYAAYFGQLGEIVIVNPYAKQVVDVDVLVLPGGPDWNPDFYNEVPGLFTQKGRIEWDFFMDKVFWQYRALRIPIIGICAGMQWMNVWAGGTLIQHLPHVVPFHKVNGESSPDSPVHAVYIENITIPGSTTLLFSERTIYTTSRHHQAVGVMNLSKTIKEDIWVNTKDKKGNPGLGINIIPFGRSLEQDSKDVVISPLSVVEVIVNFEADMIGVQYHPESNMCQDTLELFSNFITYVQTKTSVTSPQPSVAEAVIV